MNVITDRRLSVLASSPEGTMPVGESLLDHVAGLSDLITPEVVRSGADCLPVGPNGRRVRVIAAGDFLCFEFLEQDAAQDELERLRRRNTFLEKLIDKAPIGIIVVDRQERICCFNRQQELNSHVARENVMGRKLGEVFSNAPQKNPVIRMSRDSRSGLSRLEWIRFDHYRPQFYDQEMTFRISLLDVGQDFGTAIFCEIEQDLFHEMRKVEKRSRELRRSRRFLSAILDASPNLVLSIDSRRRVMSINRTAELSLGYPAREVLHNPVDRFFPADELPVLLEAVASPDRWCGTFHLVRRDGSTFLTELTATKVRNERSGREIATLLLATDIEETKKLKANLIQSQKMSFLGQMMGGLAHQLNNPLVGVVNIADMLLDSLDANDPSYESIRMIRSAGETCREVISRLLRFSRRSSGNQTQAFDVGEVLNAALDLVCRHELFEAVRLKTRFQPALQVHGEPVLLQQVFINILWNAAQAVAPGGSITVETAFHPAPVREVEVTISDTGCGIPEEHIAKVLDPFFTTKDADGGTGLGLSLAYWIVREHLGRITVESRPGCGTSVHVHLPAG
ncbi:MAG: ATP-binding protein [Desulfomonilia bacterium]